MRVPTWRDHAEAAYDEYKRDLMDRGEIHTIRQLRKREFLAGYEIASRRAVGEYIRGEQVRDTEDA